jgi:threonine dehydrogenase-like Zn-dependent dehydrogenase
LPKKMGADCMYNPIMLGIQGMSPFKVIMEETKGVGAHVQIEATESKEKTLSEIEDAIAVGGKIIQIGIGRYGPAHFKQAAEKWSSLLRNNRKRWSWYMAKCDSADVFR